MYTGVNMGRSTKPNGTTSAKQIEDTEKQARVLKLRIAGYSLAQIAAIEGYADPSGALRAVKAGIRRACLEPAEELRRIQIARYEHIIMELWPLVVHDVEAMAEHQDGKEAQPFFPNMKALDRLLKAFQQLEAVGGLNVLKVAPTNPEGDEAWKPPKANASTAADIFNVLASAGIIKPAGDQGTNTAPE